MLKFLAFFNESVFSTIKSTIHDFLSFPACAGGSYKNRIIFLSKNRTIYIFRHQYPSCYWSKDPDLCRLSHPYNHLEIQNFGSIS